MLKIPIKIVGYIVKKNPQSIEWSNPLVQDNIEFVYHIVKHIILP